MDQDQEKTTKETEPIINDPNKTTPTDNITETSTPPTNPTNNESENTTEVTTEPSATSTEPANDQQKEPPKTKLSQKNKILISLLVVIILAIAGVLIWYFAFRTPAEPQNNQTAIEPTPIETSKLTLQSNELSDFDLTFLKLDNSSDNIIYSPLSIKYALGMLADGANGDSETQITNLLGEYQPKAYLNSANRSLANAMFVRNESDFPDLIKDSYIDTIKTKYGASIIYDSFRSPDNANNWINDETLGIINDIFNEDNFNTQRDFALANALAIDMKWHNQLQCTDNVFSYTMSSDDDNELTCKYYSVNFAHEKYYEYISIITSDDKFSKLSFNDGQETPAAEIGATANRYDIIKELGEDFIRETVQAEREKWLQEGNEDHKDYPFSLDEYMDQLGANYGKLDESTDFLFYDSDTEKAFAKDLREYDGSTLEYIGVMPKTSELNDYINNLDAKYLANIINNLKKSSDLESYKDGVVTKIYGFIPFFNYDYDMKNLKDNLKELGITDVFDRTAANLSDMVRLEEIPENVYIMDAAHKANIDFSNDGIKAAAATVLSGGRGSAGGGFDYEWDVPIEEIDLTFDKPFLFIIRDKASGEVWFTGAVYTI